MSIETTEAEYIGAKVNDLKAEATFDARRAITDASYPEDSVQVYANARLAHELNVRAYEGQKARFLAESIREAAVAEASQHASIESDPEEAGVTARGYAEADAEATALEAEVVELGKAIRSSVLTYHLRGLAPVQWRLIDKKWRKEIKAPVRSLFPATDEGEEEFQQVTVERNMERNDKLNHDLLASSIVKVTNAKGESDTSVWKHADVEALAGAYLESEYEKLLNLMKQLTFANNLFQVAVEQDADFLPKP